MPPINLTEGAIAMLSSGDAQGTDIKPVLQVADIRLVNTQNQNNNERYRILLSDGSFTQQGMLATQRNELVRSEKLQKGSIVQLTQFVCNLIQNRMIIIIIDLDVIVEKCDPIGEPTQYPPKTDGNVPSVARSSTPGQPMNQPAVGNPPSSYSVSTAMSSSASRPNVGGGIQVPYLGENRNAGPHSYSSSFSSNLDTGRYNATNNPPIYPKTEAGSGVSRPPVSNYVRPPHSSYQQPPPMWTIKARVTAKGELRHYNNPRGDGKVFSFDLLDSDGGEIRVTCFNAVADQFYQQIEPGRVYMISRGTLKPAQKAFNHLRNDHEIMLDSLENNSVVDLIAIVTSISPSSSIMRKNGTETQKRTLQLKDMSGRSVELTLWGNFCNAEGQTLQNMCDSGVFPVLAVKSGRVNDFNGKSVGTISTSQLFIEPDFPEAQKLKTWFNTDGKSTPAISISRETSMVRTDARKTISQIKDEKLGTSEKPDWITVSATLTFIKVDNFCYTACPVMIGDRQCNKKVTNNGDGKWRCDRCDQLVDECDYRYILQMQIQDHTGLTWVTAFQESGEEIMVKEETFSDEQRVKSTVVKAEKVNFQTETKYLLDLISNFKEEDSGSLQPKTESVITASGMNTGGFGSGINSTATRQSGVSASQMNSYGSNQYGGSRLTSPSSTGMYMSCSSCGGTGHNSMNCPSLMSGPGQSYGTGIANKVTPGASGGGASGECYKCHQFGHWARIALGTSNAPPAYGSSNVTPGRYGMASKQHVGGF
ncbi:hypothetical protein DH2020_005848 [Rehmannia glutinosa]|uniref:CCHC-type domain-containing protein n=1 Tax=Rehmannia glutinosa TaxID=99300 RepID=A0ABR0XH76_REHGL